MRRFVAATVEAYGRLDVIVNNAGYGVRGRVEETPVEDYRRLMEVNFLGTVHGCAGGPAPHARAGPRRDHQRVVHRGPPRPGRRGAYAATKAAQISLTEALRLELRGTSIAACTVHPIGTHTEFAEVAAASGGRKGDRSGRCSRPTRWRAPSRPAPAGRAPRSFLASLSRAIVWVNAVAPGLIEPAGRARRPSSLSWGC
jgi:NAD(P)-dependent dehydrogenase (short-subunit alcohol dehydrogenase family)